MRWSDRRKKLRAVMEGGRCVHPASVWDPMSARVAEDLGHDVGILAGSVASLMVLGAPDVVVMTLSDMAEQCKRVCRATEMPLLVDADHGFGNALSVMRTIEDHEIAGVSALSIEDTVLPVEFAQKESVKLTSMEEGLGKMQAAVEARRDPDFLIAARTSAPVAAGIDETIRRITAYQETGVDALFVVGLKTMDEIKAVSDAAKLPMIISYPGDDVVDLDALSETKARICLQPHLAVQAALKATRDTMVALQSGVPSAEIAASSVDKQLSAEATRKADYDDWAKRFLG